MSFKTKRTLNDLTNDNNKRLKNDSGIDLNFDIGELKTKKTESSISISSESFIEDNSMFDDGDDSVFEDEQISLSKSTNQIQGRKRLNGTSIYRTKENKKKENIEIDQTLNQLREEQARIDAHSLSVKIK